MGLFFPMHASAVPYPLDEGTPIRLRLAETVKSSKSREGDKVKLKVVEDVFATDGKTILIQAGTEAWGSVVEVEKRGRLGNKGTLALMIEGTRAVNGRTVPLRASINREGQSKLGTVVALSLIVTPLFLFMRGKDAKILAGTELSAYIDRDTVVDLPESTSPARQVATDSASLSVPGYLLPFVETDDTSKQRDALKALNELKAQGLLSGEEYEAKLRQLQHP